jgi:ABC-type hemin transport system substrate-binding protein
LQVPLKASEDACAPVRADGTHASGVLHPDACHLRIGDRQVFSTPEACVPVRTGAYRLTGLTCSRNLSFHFMRIVSLLPSTTEIVCALGLENELVGITHECDYPEAITDRPRLTASRISHETMTSKEIDHAVRSQLDGHGSIYDLDEKRLRELNPDLILTQELCDVCAVSYKIVAQAARAFEADVKVVSLEPNTIEDIFANVRMVGELAGRAREADNLVESLRTRLDQVRAKTSTVLSSANADAGMARAAVCSRSLGAGTGGVCRWRSCVWQSG